MGLFDAIAGQVLGSLGQTAGGNGTLGAIGALLEQSGGLQGLVERFRAGGLGDVVDSWIGTGRNLPVSAEQIRAILGSDEVRQVARQFGLSPDAIAGHIADVLPKVVDHATPGGVMPEASALDGLLQGLKGLGR